MRTSFQRLARFSLYAAAFACMLPLAGCKKPKYPQCKKDKHCKVDLGEKCVDGQCQNCTTNEDCKGKGPNGEDWTCFEFRCTDPNEIPAGAGGPGSEGSPCTQTIDCSGGLVCTAGKCSKCTDDVACAPGTCDLATGLCTTPGGGTGGGSCSSDNDCAMDEICDNGTCVFSGIDRNSPNPCGLEAAIFDFASPTLRSEDQEALKQFAECVKGQAKKLFLEAHADSRGTEEYNIMLTDKRGNGVKKFLEDLGVGGDKMTVISKGDLEASGTDDTSMQKDRRVEFIFGD